MDLSPPAPLRCGCLNCTAFNVGRAKPATSPSCTSGQCGCRWCELALASFSPFHRQLYFGNCLRKKPLPDYNLRPRARQPAGFYKE